MVKLKKNNSGFTAVEVLLVLLTLAIIGVVGYFVAKHIEKKPVTPTATTTSASTKKPTTPAPTPSPYAGWKTFTSTYQKLNIKYPDSWQLTDSSSSNGNDLFTITATDGFTLNFQAVVPVGAASSESVLVSSQPVTFANNSDYILFYSSSAALNNTTTGPVDTASLSTSSTELSLPSTNSSDGSVWDISMNAPSAVNVSDLTTNSDFQNAKLIIGSASY